MEEIFDRSAIAIATGALPYTIYSNPSVKELLLALTDLREITNRETLEKAIDKMTNRRKMADRVETIDMRYKKVK